MIFMHFAHPKTANTAEKKIKSIIANLFSARQFIYHSINYHQTGNKQMEDLINTCCSALTAWCTFLF